MRRCECIRHGNHQYVAYVVSGSCCLHGKTGGTGTVLPSTRYEGRIYVLMRILVAKMCSTEEDLKAFDLPKRFHGKRLEQGSFSVQLAVETGAWYDLFNCTAVLNISGTLISQLLCSVLYPRKEQPLIVMMVGCGHCKMTKLMKKGSREHESGAYLLSIYEITLGANQKSLVE